jgi:hypothetical protein
MVNLDTALLTGLSCRKSGQAEPLTLWGRFSSDGFRARWPRRNEVDEPPEHTYATLAELVCGLEEDGFTVDVFQPSPAAAQASEGIRRARAEQAE